MTQRKHGVSRVRKASREVAAGATHRKRLGSLLNTCDVIKWSLAVAPLEPASGGAFAVEAHESVAG